MKQKTHETKGDLIATGTFAMTETEAKAAEAFTNQEILGSDVLIPRLLLMQGISPMVMGRKAQIGDFVRSTTSEKLGDPDKPVDIIPLAMVNTWINFETAESAGSTAPAFRGQEARTAANERLEWQYKGPNDEDMFRRKAITLYALLPSDVEKYNAEMKRALEAGEAPDLDRTVLPVVITFQSTSFKYAGKKCASFFNAVRVNAAKFKGLAPFHYTLPLTCREEKKGAQSWYIFDIGQAKPLRNTELREAAANWVNVLGQGNVKVDDSTGEVDESSGSSDYSAVEV